MIRRVAFPFLTLPDAAVGFRGWLLGDPGQPLLPAKDTLDDWDYERDLEVSAGFDFDFDAIAEALDMPKDEVRLVVVLKGGTGAGTMPRRVDRLSVVEVSSDMSDINISAPIASWRLSGRLRVEAGVLLDRTPGSSGPLSPSHVGARLWSAHKDILIEDGGDARFPIEVAGFSDVFRDPSLAMAPWFVQWRAGNLDGDFGGSVRVYVNSDYPVMAERFVNGDPATLQAILGDVMSQLISAVVQMDDAEESLADCSEGSVSEQVRKWMDIAFPGSSPSSIRSMLDTTPGRFHSAVLAAARVGGDE